MRTLLPALTVIGALSVSACGGSSSGGTPTAPGTSSSTWTFTGRVIETTSGAPVANATVSAGSVSATTQPDGRFELSQPSAPRLPLEVTITADGHLTRTTRLKTPGSDVDMIATGGGFDLAFYRQLARNAYDKPGDIDVIRAWPTAPRYYIRTVYADAPEESVDRNVVAMARSELPEATRVLSGGRFTSVQIDSGTTEFQRMDGVVLISFYRGDLPMGANYCGSAYVGPPSSEAAFTLDKPGCTCGTRKVAAATLWHEIGHALGLRHTAQAGDHLMAPMLEDRCSTTPHLSALEALHVPIANHRPLGNMDVDRDPTDFSFIRPETAAQPFEACGRRQK